MKSKVFTVIAILLLVIQVKAQTVETENFRWGNGFYYNLSLGGSITFNELEIKLLKVENHYNLIKIGEDSLWLKVARRSMPEEINGVRIFVADNKKVKELASDTLTHGILKKDALICLSDANFPLLDPLQFTFPVSFNEGFTWNVGEDSYPFSYYKSGEQLNSYCSYPGIGFSLNDAHRSIKHWLVTVENSKVAWIENLDNGEKGNQTFVLLKSESYPETYYLYGHLDIKNIVVKKGQELKKGDVIGTALQDESWGYFHFAVIYSATEPTIRESFHNIVNGFPQLFSLYFYEGKIGIPNFTRGKIVYGMPRHISKNQLNIQEFETYSGKGWVTGRWNPADKVEWVSNEREGNARMRKELFEGTSAQSLNPNNFFEYYISVKNGTYRIRAKVGDLYLPSWQKIEFEGLNVGIRELDAGHFEWTNERIVKVQDGKLNVRFFVDSKNQRVAGVSEIVFQQINLK